MNYYQKTADEVLEIFHLDPDQGLTKLQAEEKLATVGNNALPEENPETKLQILIRQFGGPLVPVLLGAMVVTFLLGENLDAVVILVAILVNVSLGFIQEYQAQEAISELKKLAVPMASVIRDGRVIKIPSIKIVPGDVLWLEEGMAITADARLIELSSLYVDESILTGESQSVGKQVDRIEQDVIVNDQTNMVFAGTNVVKGNGKAIVVATGTQTELGKIAQDVAQAESEKTPLQLAFGRLGKSLLIAVALLTVVIFGIGIAGGQGWYEMFLFAIALSVSVLPEGLVIAVTLALAVGMRRMARRKALVRTLPSVEALGSVNVIAADKTGTLTRNRLSVRQIFASGVRIDGQSSINPDAEIWRQMIRISTLANDAKFTSLREEDRDEKVELSNGDNTKTEDVGDSGVGDPLELALLEWLDQREVAISEVQQRFERVNELPFSADYQMMAVHVNERESGERYLMVKGSPRRIIDHAKFELIEDKVITLGEGVRESLLEESRDMAADGLKPLGFAYVRYDADLEMEPDKLPEWIFAGLVGFADPVRPQAIESVAQVQGAGVRVMMLTGDHRLTAAKIAEEVGIHNHEYVLKGIEIDQMDDLELRSRLAEVNVFARVTPKHKFRIVNLLRDQGAVVAMTGDGVNDAPALVKADVGIAMGQGGTDVARGAADIVLVDNNFATIAAAVEEGRVIFDNIKKTVMYLLSTNVSEVMVVMVSLIIGWPLPLYPTQILWLNLVTDGLPDSAFVFELKEPGIMRRKPRPKDAFVLDRKAIVRLVILGISMSVVGLLIFAYYFPRAGIEYTRTMVLVVMAFSQLANAINIKSEEHNLFKTALFDNWFMVGAILISAVFQILVLELGFLQTLFRTVPLKATDWIVVFASAGAILAVDGIWKRFQS